MVVLPPRPEKSKKMDSEAETEPNKQLLPDDLVLDIVARCGTIADAIRCASTSKSVRRGILSAPFLRRLRGLLLRDGGEYGQDHPVLPRLLLGLYHQSGDPARQPEFAPASDGASPPPSVATLTLPPAPGGTCSACDFKPYLPVASRRSLLVLRRRCKNTAEEHLTERHGVHPVELSVCNPTTGDRRVLPPNDVLDMSHVLLDVDPIAPSSASFKLLVAELSNSSPRALHVQIFSSDEGSWSPALACPITSRCEFAGAGRPRPVVLGDTVHWLCTSRHGHCVLTLPWRGGEAQEEASIVRLPRGCESCWVEKCLAVLPSAAASSDAEESPALLSLIVLERGEIGVWARERGGDGSTSKWNLWHRIQGSVILRPTELSSGWLRSAELSWFCEGSGTLFLRAGDGSMSPLLLDLDSMEVRKLEARRWELNPEPEFCPYEVDVLSYMLHVMKQF